MPSFVHSFFPKLDGFLWVEAVLRHNQEANVISFGFMCPAVGQIDDQAGEKPGRPIRHLADSIKVIIRGQRNQPCERVWAASQVLDGWQRPCNHIRNYPCARIFCRKETIYDLSLRKSGYPASQIALSVVSVIILTRRPQGWAHLPSSKSTPRRHP